MLVDVISAEYCGDYKIRLTFEDGKSGIIDFVSYLDRGGVFVKFSDIEYFKAFTVDPELRTLTWDGEIDISPEVLYSKATGSRLPDWMHN